MENIEKVIDKILDFEDLTYMAHLIVTLEMNKIESCYQHPENPAIFQRDFDEFYLTRKFSINAFYSEYEDEMMSRIEKINDRNFLAEKAADAAIVLETAPNKLEKTISAFRLENAILDRIKQKYPGYYEKFPLVLQKSYDEAGFIKSYSIISEQLEKIKNCFE